MEISASELLKQVTASVEKASGDFSAKAEQAFKEAKAAGDMSKDTKASIDKLANEFNTLTKASDALKAQLGEVEQTIAAGMGGTAARAAAMSAGSEVTAFEPLKAFAAKVSGNEQSRISIPVNAALLSSGVGIGIVEPHRVPGIDMKPKQRLFIRDLIAAGRVTAPAIFWVQQTGFTNAARVVAEGQSKPYSQIEFASKITAVSTIAHMFKASKQILDDMAQLGSLIDGELDFGLKYAEEQEILFGDGTGVHLLGIVPQATPYSDIGIPGGASATAIDALRWAMLQAQLARVPASGHVLHFTDWAKIEMAKDELGRYIIGNPQGTVAPSLWNLPVVPTEIPAFLGKFLTGAFRNGAQLFDREDANVVISTENADDFERNMISVRCEERAALAVYRPEGFIFGDLPKAA